MAAQSLHFFTPTNASRSHSASPSLRQSLLPQRLRIPRSSTAPHTPPPDLNPSPIPVILSSNNGIGGVSVAAAASAIDVDAVTEAELKENGFRSTRRTKLVCTIGPATCEAEQIEALAVGGMNVARVNMCHGTHDWHRRVIRQVRRLNEEKGFAVAVMMDTEGSEIHMGDLGGFASAKAEDGEVWTFSVRALKAPLPERTINVNYDGFAEDVRVGEELLVDGGMVRFEVIEKLGPDVKCKCTDPGLLLPRANLTFWRDGSLVRERNAMLPTISSKDWLDIDFGIAEGVDFIAVSFVKSAEVINHLKSYIAARCCDSERDVPTINIQLHYAHCSRNLQKCSICGEIVPIKHADEHFKESHAPIDCSLCSETIEREGWSLHQDEKCPKRIVTCEFCEFPLPAADLLEHQEVCGNRTELCHTCNKYIRLRELIRHEFHCQSHSNGSAESSGTRNESLIDREGDSVRRDDENEPSGEGGRRRGTRGSPKSRIICTIAIAGIAMLIGSFFLSRRG